MGKNIWKLSKVFKRRIMMPSQEDIQAKAKAEAEKQALAKASAITDSGRTTDVVNDTTETPGSVQNQSQTNRPANSTDDLMFYINDMRNRRRAKGAALPQMSGVLGQVGALGV